MPSFPVLSTRPRQRDRYAQAADAFKSRTPPAEHEAESEEKLIAKSPLGITWIEPEAVAPVVVFLASRRRGDGERRDLRRNWWRQRQLHRLGPPAINGARANLLEDPAWRPSYADCGLPLPVPPGRRGIKAPAAAPPNAIAAAINITDRTLAASDALRISSALALSAP